MAVARAAETHLESPSESLLQLLLQVAAGLGALLAVAFGILLPGAAIVRWLDLGRDRLERFALAVACGRVAFAVASLAAVAIAGRPLPWITAGTAALAYAAARAARPRPALRRLARPDAVAVGVAIAGAVVLAHAIVARSGLRDAAGSLVFFGRDSAFDPIVYAAASVRLIAAGLPLTHPFAAGSPATAQYVHLAIPGALDSFGVTDLLAVLFRALPFFDLAAAGITSACLARALGGGAFAIASAPAWLLLASAPAFLLPPIAPLVGGVGRTIDTWAFFGPYLLPFNPITPALQALFAALLLALGTPARRGALVAGLLVGSLFEIKIFLWAPAIGGLAAAAWIAPPRGAARWLRVAFATALAASLPSLVEKALAGARYEGIEEIGFRLCVACLPQYLIGATWLGQDVSFGLFRSFRLGSLAAPAALVNAMLVTAITVAVAFGARAVALPELWQGLREGRAGLSASQIGVRRWMLAAALLGVGAACTIVVAPHYLNGAQFAWIACFGLAPFAAVRAGRWTGRRRAFALAAVVFLSVPSTLDCLLRLGWGAAPSLRVSRDEQELLAALAADAGPSDAVLEPSLLGDADVPSPVPWLAGLPVRASLLSTLQVLAPAEQERRLREIAAVFAERDAGAARRAIRESGVRYVYAPARWPIRFPADGLLEPVARNAAGTVYRVAR